MFGLPQRMVKGNLEARLLLHTHTSCMALSKLLRLTFLTGKTGSLALLHGERLKE